MLAIDEYLPGWFLTTISFLPTFVHTYLATDYCRWQEREIGRFWLGTTFGNS